MKALFSGLLLSGLLSFAMADATSAVPQRVGPVSNYGVLGTSGNQVISTKTNKQVMLRGMSLFWADAVGSQYYSENVIAWAAQTLGIDVFRFAMGIESYDSDGGNSEKGKILASYSYKSSPDVKIEQLDRMVKAAIENDIYIIVDWHSHRAEQEQSIANDFFGKMATKYKDVPNIIWEVYNEPVNTDMGTIASYANTVIGTIRKNGSKNLALVGTPKWSQMGSCGGVNQPNVGYVFHFYAASHSVNSYSGNVDNCMKGGNAVFVTEWGATSADGSGTVNTSEAGSWTSYMERNKISNCNWSLRHATVGDETEQSAMFSGSEVLNNKTLLNGAKYTQSGEFVKKYLTTNKRSWEDTLTAGHSGSCKFSNLTVSELDGSKSGVGKSGCSYTSSNENVATIGTDGSLTIKSHGYALMTGNDGSMSVVTVEAVPEQTVSGLVSMTCTVTNLKKAGTCTNNYTGKSSSEYQFTTMVKSAEGGEITCTSDNPSVVKIEKAICSTSQCYSHKGEYQWIATFTGAVGLANIRVQIPAVSGFKAMDTTFVLGVIKSPNIINPAVFKDVVVEKNSVTELFPATAHTVPVTYTLSAEGFGVIDGTNFIAGDKDASLVVYATSEESETYAAVNQSIVITIGLGGELIDGISPRTLRNVGIQGRIQNGNLMLTAAHSGFAKVQVYNANGKDLLGEETHYVTAGTNVFSLKRYAHGMYYVKVKQSSVSMTIPWSNK